MTDPLALELAAIQQGISKADLLQQQAQQARPIGSITQGLAQLAQAFFAGKAQNKAKGRLTDFTAKNQAIADKQSQALSDALASVQSGKPVPASVVTDASPALKRSLLASGLSSNATVAAAKAKAGVKAAAETKKTADDLKKANASADLLIKQGRLDPKNRASFVKANAAGGTGLIKPKGNSLIDAFKAGSDSRLQAETKASRDKGREKFIDSFRATTNFDRNAKSLQEFVLKQPASATLTGDSATLIDGAFSAAVALKDQLNIRKGSTFSSNIEDYNLAGVTGLAKATAEERSRVFSLAYSLAAAKGQTGHSVSDKDIKKFIGMIAGSFRSPSQLGATLGRIRQEIKGDFETEKKIALGLKYVNEADLKNFSVQDAAPQQNTQGTTFSPLPQGANLSDGVHTDAQGNRIEVKNGQFRNL